MEQKVHRHWQVLSALKRIIALIAILVFSANILQSQCPGGMFITQNQIDSFPINYPNCTAMDGWVEIYGNDITNLDGLIQLESIGLRLVIDNVENLINIEGLSNVSHIGSYIWVTSNPLLSSLSGLNSLDSCHEHFWIIGNDALADISGLENLSYVNDLDIVDNPLLTNLNGLETLTSVGGSMIISGDILESVAGLSNLHYVNGYCSIDNSDSLQNLNGLENLDSIGGHFGLDHNTMLSNIESLNNLSKIGGILTLSNNFNLESLHGLEGLRTIGSDLRIHNNTSLSSLSGLDSLTSIGGDLQIYENNSLQTLSGIDNIDALSIMNLSITYNPQLSYCEAQSVCDYLANPNGDIQIYVNATGCNNSVEVEEACTVGIPEKTSNHQLLSYPNPLTTSTTIEYELTEPSHVQLIIYNAIGEAIYTIEYRMMPQGSHKVTWSPRHLPEGLYYAVLRSEEGVSGVKIIKQ